MKKPTVFGKYLLLERLNVGGMAEVFVAKAFGVEGFERILAIKKILPTMAEDAEFITMFIDEARISVQLNHANVVHIHELGKHDDAYYIAMEYVSGKDLRSQLERFRRRKEIMPTAMAVFCATKICEGLDYAHRKKDARGQDLHIIHRDVSPQNILLAYEGEVKIIDFGIAKAANRSQKTQAGILKGKFGYMSPEQVRGLPIDRRSDVFAVGVIIYEMLTGEKLFVGESDFSTLEKVRNAEVPLPRQFNPNIPAGLERVVMKALAREAEDRYQWASDLQEDLMRFLLAGDAIYSCKHLSAFMKDAFAEDLLREGEKLERFAEVERPEQIEMSSVGLVPKKEKAREKDPPPTVQSRTLTGPIANGNVAVAYQGEVGVIPPPTTDELAQMDRSDDRTIMVAADMKAEIDLKTAIGLKPVTRAEEQAAASGQPKLRPATPKSATSGTATTHDRLDTTLPPQPRHVSTAGGSDDLEKTLLPGRTPGIVVPPATSAPRPAPSPAAPIIGRSATNDTGNDLRPIENTGFRPVPSRPNQTSADRTGADEDDDGTNDTLMPGTRKPSARSPRIVIGSGPPHGATSIAQVPTEEPGAPPAADEVEPGNSGQYQQHQPDDDEIEPDGEVPEGEYDAPENGQDDQQDGTQADGEEVEPEQDDEQDDEEVSKPKARKPAAKKKPAKKADTSGGGARNVFLYVIGALAIVVIVAVGFVLLKAKSGSLPTIVILPKPTVPFVVSVKGKQIKDPAAPIPLAAGKYSLEVKPTDSAYKAKTVSVTVDEKDVNRFVTVAFDKSVEVGDDAIPDETPVVAKKDPVIPKKDPDAVAKKDPDTVAKKDPDTVAKKDPETKKDPAQKPPDAPSTFTAIVSSKEVGVEIVVRGRVVGQTPSVTITNLSFQNPGSAMARKAGFEDLTIPFDNPDKKATLDLPFVMKKRIDKPVAKKEPDVVAKKEPTVKKEPDAAKRPDAAPAPVGKAMGKAAFTSTPLGAEVWVDGKNTAKKTPIPKPAALELTAGKHKVVFKNEGKASPPQEFEVTAGDTVVVRGSIE